MTSLVDILLAARRAVLTHRRGPSGACVACKAAVRHPCRTYELAERVAALLAPEVVDAPDVARRLATPPGPRMRPASRHDDGSPWGHDAPRQP